MLPAEYLEIPALLTFAGIEPTSVPCSPITQQIAEKYHAYTLTHLSGASSRVKDAVDMLLLGGMGQVDGKSLRQAIIVPFEDHKTHELSERVPLPPSD